jgi:prevent-host-death family protein
MARIVNMHEAKSQLSRLVAEVAAGEEVLIAKAGKPVAKLVRYDSPRPRRQPGAWRGRVWISEDFDELPPELLAAFNHPES